jgi:hypothetical protein
MASVIDLVWTDCDDLFRNLEVDAMFRRQREILSGGHNQDYPSAILINSVRITLGVRFGDNTISGRYAEALIGDKSGPQIDPLFDWGYLEDPTE